LGGENHFQQGRKSLFLVLEGKQQTPPSGEKTREGKGLEWENWTACVAPGESWAGRGGLIFYLTNLLSYRGGPAEREVENRRKAADRKTHPIGGCACHFPADGIVSPEKPEKQKRKNCGQIWTQTTDCHGKRYLWNDSRGSGTGIEGGGEDRLRVGGKGDWF